MTLTILFVSLADLASAVAWRRAWRRGATPAALILLSIPLAAIPAIVGVTSGAWQLRYALSQIAATGAGGLGSITIVAQDAVRSVVVGVVVFVLFMIVATIVALWSAKRSTAGAGRMPAKGAASALLAVLAIAAFGLTAGAAMAAERAAAGSIARFAAVTVPPPARFTSVAQGSTADWVGELERLSNATTAGGVVLIGLFAGAVWLMSRSPGLAGNVRLSPAVAVGFAAVTIGAAAVYLVQVQPTLVWLGDLVARART
jgi:hypothetical protein